MAVRTAGCSVRVQGTASALALVLGDDCEVGGVGAGPEFAGPGAVRHFDGQLLDVLVPPDALLVQVVVVVLGPAPAPVAAGVAGEIDRKADIGRREARGIRTEEHKSELQS